MSFKGDDDKNEFRDAAHDAVDRAVTAHEEEYQTPRHDDVEAPSHLEEGYTGLRAGRVYGIIGVLALALIISGLIAFANSRRAADAQAHPTPAPAVTQAASLTLPGSLNPGSSNTNGGGYCDPDAQENPEGGQTCSNPQNTNGTNCNNGNASGFVFGAAGACGSNPQTTPNPTPAICASTPLPASQTGFQSSLPRCVPSTGSAVNGGCPPGYQPVTIIVGQPPSCVQSDGTGKQTNGGNGQSSPPPAPPTPTPLPGQSFDVATGQTGTSGSGTGSNGTGGTSSQEQQAQADLAAREAQPQPVYANGQLVGYVYPAGGLHATMDADTSEDNHFVSPQPGPTAGASGGGGGGGTGSAPRPGDSFAGGTNAAVGYHAKVSNFQLCATTVVPLSLITKIDSESPGYFLATVRANIYDCFSHQHIVIPQGTIAAGQYDSRLVANQTKLIGAITLLKFADGREFDFGNQEVTDALGGAGMAGDVNKHTGQLLTAGALLTVFTAAEAVLTSAGSSSNILATPTLGQQLQTAAGGQIANIANRVLQQGLERPPTITMDPTQHPWYFNALVMRDLPLDEYLVQPGVAHLVPVLPGQAPTPIPRVMPMPVLVPTPTPLPARFCC